MTKERNDADCVTRRDLLGLGLGITAVAAAEALLPRVASAAEVTVQTSGAKQSTYVEGRRKLGS